MYLWNIQHYLITVIKYKYIVLNIYYSKYFKVYQQKIVMYLLVFVYIVLGLEKYNPKNDNASFYQTIQFQFTKPIIVDHFNNLYHTN